MLELILAVIVVGTGGYAALLVWRKVPLLLQVPQQLIEESFVTRPSRVKHALEATTAFIREERYYDFFYASVFALLQGLRLRLVRLERSVFHLASMVEARLHAREDDQQHFWDELKKERAPASETIPAPIEELPNAVVAAILPPASVKQPEPMKESREHRVVVRTMDSVAPRGKTVPRQKARPANHRISVRRLIKRTPPVAPEAPVAS